jgi:hypothetical protein
MALDLRGVTRIDSAGVDAVVLAAAMAAVSAISFALSRPNQARLRSPSRLLT